jgi:hypothetical protein
MGLGLAVAVAVGLRDGSEHSVGVVVLLGLPES